MEKQKTPESKVSAAINQESSSIVIGGKEYNIAPPAFGTLAKVSEIVSNAPDSKRITDDTNMADVIARAKNESFAPAVLAALILGSKNIEAIHYEDREVKCLKSREITRFRFGIFPYREVEEYEEMEIQNVATGTEFEHLTNVFTHDVRISEVIMAVADILQNRMDTAFFLQGIIFLKEVSLTTQTKKT